MLLLLLYKPKGNIINHRDLFVTSNDAKEHLHDFPGSICISYSSITSAYNTECFNGMLGTYEIRSWLVPKNNSNFIILKHETIDIQTQT